jgi:hypothetical protein
MTRTLGTLRCLAGLLLAILGVALPAELAHAQIQVPTGFDERLVVDVGLPPTALAFTPDGRMLIATQSGRLLIKMGEELLPTPAIDLSPRICSNSERGLLGVAVDPAFAENHYIYLYYTFNKHDTCGTRSARVPVNRVSRVVLGDDNLVDPDSEQILLDNIQSMGGNHNGGDLHFGPDGYLYVAVGDGGCDYLFNSGCAGANDAARDPHVLLGKILRITRDGGIPPTNPFQGEGTARCALTGRAEWGVACQETFASGLRNPFRFAFDLDATEPRLFINDVGQNDWEERGAIADAGNRSLAAHLQACAGHQGAHEDQTAEGDSNLAIVGRPKTHDSLDNCDACGIKRPVDHRSAGGRPRQCFHFFERCPHAPLRQRAATGPHRHAQREHRGAWGL